MAGQLASSPALTAGKYPVEKIDTKWKAPLKMQGRLVHLCVPEQIFTARTANVYFLRDVVLNN
jgi:hypothetical protein